MWYRLSFKPSEFWNLNVENDPRSLNDAFLGLITSSREKTNDPNIIEKNLASYAQQLIKENFDYDDVKFSYENALTSLSEIYPDYSSQKINLNEEGFEDWKQNAQSWIGTPYKFGGSDEKGIDCSAFVQKVFPNLPRTAVEQQSTGISIPIDQPSLWQPGDRLYFNLSERQGKDSDHVGIYWGGNQMIHASSNQKGVAITEIPNRYLSKLVSVMR